MVLQDSEKIKKRYNRISRIYDLMDKMINEESRKKLLAQVEGDVLEVGVGTGANLFLYPNTIQSYTGIDFSPGMLAHAKRKAFEAHFHYPLELLEEDVQNLPFKNDMFDSIVSTCVFCSVPDPMNGLKELRRICKPNGKIYMIEHMRSENKLVGSIMDLLNPLTVRLWGANINRETLKNIELAGFKVEEQHQMMGTILQRMVLSPKK